MIESRLSLGVRWKRPHPSLTAAALGGEKPPEFMSTHPSDETRIRQLNERMPEAMKYYKGN